MKILNDLERYIDTNFHSICYKQWNIMVYERAGWPLTEACYVCNILVASSFNYRGEMVGGVCDCCSIEFHFKRSS